MLCMVISRTESRAAGSRKHFQHRSWEPGRTCLGHKIEGEAYTVIKILSIFCHMFYDIKITLKTIAGKISIFG